MQQINEEYAISEEVNRRGLRGTILYKTPIDMGQGLWEETGLIQIKSWGYKPYEEPKKISKQEIEHEIILNDWSRWNTELKEDMVVEVSEYIYHQMLNALPPKNWKGTYFEVGEPHHHDNKGKAIHRAFWKEGNKFFTGYPKF